MCTQILYYITNVNVVCLPDAESYVQSKVDFPSDESDIGES